MARCFTGKVPWLMFIGPIMVYIVLHLQCVSKPDQERRNVRQKFSHLRSSPHHIIKHHRNPDTSPHKADTNAYDNTGSAKIEASSSKSAADIVTQRMMRMKMVGGNDGEPYKLPKSITSGFKKLGVEADDRTVDTETVNSDGATEKLDGRITELLKQYVESLDKFKMITQGNSSKDIIDRGNELESANNQNEIKTKTTENSSLNKLGKVSSGVNESDASMDNILSDMKVKEFPETLEEVDLLDDKDLNADVDRALPALGVNRYADESVDPHEYRYIHNQPHHCQDGYGQDRKVFMLFMVVTAPAHFERRTVIRKTYGSESEWPALKKGVFTTVFLLGATSNATLQTLIDQEASLHRDVLQEDFVDTYANLSRKTVMGLKWATNYCRHALYVMKIDDDSMLNQGRLLWTFKGATDANWTAAEALFKSPVLRNTGNKYFISHDYYPSPTYPPYLNGPGYILSSDLAEASYKMALTTPLFPWEDVFLGTCLAKLGVKPIRHKFFLWISDPGFFNANKEYSIIKRLRMFVVVSNLSPHHMKLMWMSCKVKVVN